jgi:hypothetical protein
MDDYTNAQLNDKLAYALQAQGGALAGQAGLAQQTSLKDNLRYQLARAHAEVSRLEELLTLLDANPEVERIMHLLQKGY